MKIAIISDIHDNLVNLEKCLNWCQQNKIKQLICCGDVCNSETLKFLSNNFSSKINLVYGNSDFYPEEENKKYKNINFLGRFGVVEIFSPPSSDYGEASKQVGICHEPQFIDKVLEQDKCDIIFYGHTHKPWDENKNDTRVLNPGTLGGVFQKATFAVWDTENNNFELKILEKI